MTMTTLWESWGFALARLRPGPPRGIDSGRVVTHLPHEAPGVALPLDAGVSLAALPGSDRRPRGTARSASIMAGISICSFWSSLAEAGT